MNKSKAGRPKKIDRFDFNSIINIKHLFTNPIFTSSQSSKNWKRNHRVQVLAYHKKYNTDHHVYEQLKGYCDICQKDYTNKSQHNKSQTHIKNLNTI